MRQVARQFVQFGRARNGATAIEFAFVIVPFFFVIGCIVEIGAMLTTEYSLQNAVQDAGRIIRTGGAVSMSGTDFRDEVCNKRAAVKNCTTTLGVSVASAANFTALVVPDIASIGPGVHNFSSGASGEAVAVIATYDWQFIFPFMRPLSNVAGANFRRLQGMAVFRNEPF